MKLFELAGIKKFKNLPGNLIMKMLERQGVFKKILGKGTYGMAFELSDGEVLKVWANDKGYEQYLDYCIAHKGNPYLLKVNGKVQTFTIRHAATSKDQSMKFARIEYLDPPASLKDFGYNNTDHTLAQDAMGRLTRLLRKPLPNEDEKVLEALRLDPKNSTPEFIKFIRAMSEISSELKTNDDIFLDIHLANFGMRGKQVVVLDPLGDASEDAVSIDSILSPFTKR